jgi:hypothetical protein
MDGGTDGNTSSRVKTAITAAAISKNGQERDPSPRKPAIPGLYRSERVSPEFPPTIWMLEARMRLLCVS